MGKKELRIRIKIKLDNNCKECKVKLTWIENIVCYLLPVGYLTSLEINI